MTEVFVDKVNRYIEQGEKFYKYIKEIYGLFFLLGVTGIIYTFTKESKND
jgi:hypothetical protein